MLKQKRKKMEAIKYKTATGEVKEAILISRIDKNFFDCKSDSKKRKGDLYLHIDTILTDVSGIAYEEETSKEEAGYFSTDEFNGLCQAGELGLEFQKATELVA